MICQVIYEIVGKNERITFIARTHSQCWDAAKEYEQKHGVTLRTCHTI